jgi:hypothetical protein
MKSGGDLPTVLSDIAEDMRNEENLKGQMAAETSAQAVFIMFAVVVGAPLLFAVSTQFITIFSEMMENLDVVELTAQTQQQSLVALSPMSITGDEFGLYAMATLIVSSFFASLLLGILKSGNPSSGLSLSLILAVASVSVFFIVRMVLDALFAPMLSF